MQNGQIKKEKRRNRLGKGTREQDERAKENKQTGKRIDTKSEAMRDEKEQSSRERKIKGEGEGEGGGSVKSY